MTNEQSAQDTLEALQRNQNLSRSLNSGYHNHNFLTQPQPHLPRTPTSPSMSLPNRKRPRDALSSPVGAEFPQNKSRRATPSPVVSAPDTPADLSVDSFDESENESESDPTLQRLLGENYDVDIRALQREQLKAEKALRERREQERQDEEFARSLQEDRFETPPQFMGQPFTQSRLDLQNGRLSAMRPPPVPQNLPSPAQIPHSQLRPHATMPGAFFVPQGPIDTGRYPSSLSDSSDDLEEIMPSDFRPNIHRPPPNVASVGGPSYEPAYQPAYHGYGGSSVYPSFPSSSVQSIDSDVFGIFDNQFNQPESILSGYNNALSSVMGAGSGTGHNLNPAELLRFEGLYDDPQADPTKTAEELKSLLENIRPDDEINPEEREPTPHSMRVELMPHQKLGLTWLKNMEEGSNKGGLLADDMGLGKTVQALALIVSRKPPQDSSRKMNLIVAPVALMQQWKREIEKLIKPGHHRLSVFIYHAEGRKATWATLKNHDVVLTTYGTLASEHKRKLAWDEKVQKFPNVQPTRNEGQYPLLGPRSQWYRVILDEAQWIKNKNTRSAVAAYALDSQYRWCLTGTPMQNSLGELQSLIKFLRIKPYNSTERFNAEFLRPLAGRGAESAKDRAMEKLHALLKAILLRRTKKSTVDGRPLLQLPERTTEMVHTVFDNEQKAFYQSIESKTQLTYNRYLAAGTVGRNYSQILVLLLRLRQTCCHPALLKDHAIKIGVPTGDIDLVANARSLPADVVARIEKEAGFECPICMDAIENPTVFYPCGHWSCSECFSRISDPAQAALNAVDGDRIELKCPNCRGKIDAGKNTDLQSFNRVHKDGDVDEQADRRSQTGSVSDDDGSTDDESDDKDDDSEKDLKKFIVDDDVVEYDSDKDSESEEDEGYERGKTPFEKSSKLNGAHSTSGTFKDGKGALRKSLPNGKRGRKKKGKESEPKNLTLADLKKASMRSKAMKKKYIRKLEKDWKTSAKIEKTMEILENVDQGQGNEKTIIFCSFTSFLDLLEVPILRRGYDYRRYDGSMNPKERNEAVLDFTERRECRVMLVSLKAGNSGLNLTAASQGKPPSSVPLYTFPPHPSPIPFSHILFLTSYAVIILDPFWNPYVEEQAIDRAHRIGQTRPVVVHRILIPETVEDRILALQEKKRELIDNALDEGASRSVARLSPRELSYLFGVRHE